MKNSKVAVFMMSLILLSSCSKDSASKAASPSPLVDTAKMETPPVTATPMPTPPENAEANPDQPGANEQVSVPGNIAGAGFDPDKSSVYLIKNFASLKCLTVEDQSTANGGATEQEDCEEGNAFQKFKITEVQPGYYSIMNLGSYKVLELRDKQTVDGTVIQQNDFFAEDHQLFQISDSHDSTNRIKAKSVDAYVDVKNRSIFDGADIHLWEFRDQNNQLWIFLPTL